MSETRAILRDTVGRFLGQEYDSATRLRILRSPEGWSAQVWRSLAELGLLSLPFREADGGLGDDAEALLELMEAFGRALLLEPYISTTIVGGALFTELDDAGALARIAAGTMRLALVQDVLACEQSDGGYVLAGQASFVRDAATATHLVVAAQDAQGQAAGLFLVPADAAGISSRRLRALDGVSCDGLDFEAVAVPADAMLAQGAAASRLIGTLVDRATVALCADAIGVMRAMLEQTLAYTRERQQFGKPLSSFQVLQHRMVDMLVEIEQAQSLTLRAAMSGDDPVAVSDAKIRVNEAIRMVSHNAVQLHGAIGTTEELALSQYFRRAMVVERLYGTSAEHFERRERLLAGEEA